MKTGIDVYLTWNDMEDDEKNAQYTGFDVHSGNVGYLREAYHGEPYATAVLVSEDWDEQPHDGSKSGFSILNSVLRERLPAVIEIAKNREKMLYNGTDEAAEECAKAFVDFVELHGKLEKAGREPKIYVSY